MSRLLLAATGLLAASVAVPAMAQEMDHSQMDHSQMDHSQMDMPGMDMSAMHRAPGQPGDGSGTSRLPSTEGAMAGVHVMSGQWMLMVHGTVSSQYTASTGPRGSDLAYVTSMAMGMATRDTGWGRVQFRSMLSLEPLMSARGYPNLFATGETAGGVPIVDRQHPHDLFMELAARVDANIGRGSTLFLYGGPVAEPALGPSAFMHRDSARTNPEPPITHHWFDSTHITYGVVTAGLSTRALQVEASAFRGREPDEQRWDIETPKLDSWSVRVTLNPAPRWALQASYGELHRPEATHPDEDEHRFTATAHYSSGRLAAMAGYSAKTRVPGTTLGAWLAEADWRPDRHNVLFGRIENVANDELFPDHDDPLHEVKFRLTKLQAGYARRLPLGPVEVALGGAASAFVVPQGLRAAYGRAPHQFTVFARVSLAGGS